MLTSFHGAATTALEHQESLGEVAVERWVQLERGAVAWTDCVARTFVEGYRRACAGSRLDLSRAQDWEATLRACMIERTLDQLHLSLARGSTDAAREVRRLLTLLQTAPRARE